MKSVYLEVGKKCYSICTSCNVNDAKRPDKLMTLKEADSIVKLLNSIGYYKFRLAGYDPISFEHSAALVSNNANSKFKMTTTLLRYDPVVELVDELMISVSAVEEYYKDFFSVDHWDRFIDNFNVIASARSDIEISCTLTDALLSRTEPLVKFVNFIKEYSSSIKCVKFFDAITYGSSENKLNKDTFIEYINSSNIGTSVEFYWTDNCVKQTECYVTNETMYIKHNGDIYPCCMAGGEIGQDLLDELKVGNIFDYISRPEELKLLLKKPLVNLNNYICSSCTPAYLRVNSKWRKENEKNI